MLWQHLATEKDPARLAAFKARHDLMNGIQPVYPSMATMAVNAAVSATRYVASGGKTVDADEQARRLSICAECPFFVAGKHRCRKCGCWLKLKARVEAFHCPIDKW